MNLLALDTSTDTLSIAVQKGGNGSGAGLLERSAPGGAQSSTTLIPLIRELMGELGLSFDELDLIAFGRGPGSFTGLRTACSVAQGLAFGARKGLGVPVLPVDSLLAVAEQARMEHGVDKVLAVLDARMDEVYAAAYRWDGGQWSSAGDYQLLAPQHVIVEPGFTVAGNAQAAYGERLAPDAPTCAPCRRPGPCCAWPLSSPPAERYPPRKRCRSTSATRWPRPRPSASRPGRQPPDLSPHERHRLHLAP